MEGDFEMTKNNDQKIEIVHSNLVTFDPVGDWDKSFCIFVCNRDLKLDLLEFIIKNLIKNGCRFFSCFGKFSEFVHDFIDDIVESDHNIFIDTITVFNKKSSMEE